MQELTRGHKGKLSDIGIAEIGDVIDIAIDVAARSAGALDVSCFGVDGDAKLSDDRYFVFFNQKSAPNGAIEMVGSSHGSKECFRIKLGQLPPTIKRLVFTVTADAVSMAELLASTVSVVKGGSAVARYSFSGSDFGQEKALMMFELYFKDVWRFAAVGQGFNGGLSALLKHFGGEEAGGSPAPAPAAPAAPAATPAPKVNLGKVTLEKKGAKSTVNLTKGGGIQQIHVNLNWDNPNAGKRVGFLGLGGAAPSPDLDLGCMFRMTTGEKGVIQPLGERFGSRHALPYIYLDKDDRTGAANDGENLYILRPDLIDFVMVFALVYDGAANFANVNGRLTIKDGQQEIFIPLNNPDNQRTFCSICTIANKGGSIEITKEERYFTDHGDADSVYGFGFRWVAGQK